jgi:hypothetical protein
MAATIQVGKARARFEAGHWTADDPLLYQLVQLRMRDYAWSLERHGSVANEDLRIASWVAQRLGGRVVEAGEPSPPSPFDVVY